MNTLKDFLSVMKNIPVSVKIIREEKLPWKVIVYD